MGEEKEVRMDTLNRLIEAQHDMWIKATIQITHQMRPGGPIANEVARINTTTLGAWEEDCYADVYDAMFFESSRVPYYPSSISYNLLIPATPMKPRVGIARAVCTTTRKMDEVLGESTALPLRDFLLRVYHTIERAPGTVQVSDDLRKICFKVHDMTSIYRHTKGKMQECMEVGVGAKRGTAEEGTGFFVKRAK